MPTEIDMDATRPTPYPTTLSPFVKHVQLFTIGGRIANTMVGRSRFCFPHLLIVAERKPRPSQTPSLYGTSYATNVAQPAQRAGRFLDLYARRAVMVS